jgi:hypothetical protein
MDKDEWNSLLKRREEEIAQLRDGKEVLSLLVAPSTPPLIQLPPSSLSLTLSLLPQTHHHLLQEAENKLVKTENEVLYDLLSFFLFSFR